MNWRRKWALSNVDKLLFSEYDGGQRIEQNAG
jgi:hypothetical protein